MIGKYFTMFAQDAHPTKDIERYDVESGLCDSVTQAKHNIKQDCLANFEPTHTGPDEDWASAHLICQIVEVVKPVLKVDVTVSLKKVRIE